MKKIPVLILLFLMLATTALAGDLFTLPEPEAADTSPAEMAQGESELSLRIKELDSLQLRLEGKEQELNNLQLMLSGLQQALTERQQVLKAQEEIIARLAGIRTSVIQDLSRSMAAAKLNVMIDPQTGEIALDSALFFEAGRTQISQAGKALLDRFVPAYLDVLLQDKYADYLMEIIIEGHTETAGSYAANLKLSQQRALEVALYCMDLPSLTSAQAQRLKQVLIAQGRGEINPVFDAGGQENPKASRRIVFRFALKDFDIIDRIYRILTDQN